MASLQTAFGRVSCTAGEQLCLVALAPGTAGTRCSHLSHRCRCSGPRLWEIQRQAGAARTWATPELLLGATGRTARTGIGEVVSSQWTAGSRSKAPWDRGADTGSVPEPRSPAKTASPYFFYQIMLFLQNRIVWGRAEGTGTLSHARW